MILKKDFTAILVFASLFMGLQVNMFAQIQKGLDIDGVSISDLSGYSVSMPDSNTIAIGAPQNDNNGSNLGQVRIYSWNGSVWTQKGMEINGEAPGDRSGQSVSMPDSNTVAIGAHNNDGNGTNAGHVRIYSWNGSAWMQKGIDIDGETAINDSGYAVSMPDSNTVAIGSPMVGFSGYWNGRVRIYIWNGSAWVQKGNDINGLLTSNEESGRSVSMPDANTVAIGAPSNSSMGWHGRAVVYSWNGSAWVQKGNDFYGQTFGSNAGASVSMPDSNTVAIGAPGNDTLGINAGHVSVYSWSGSDWVQKGMNIYGETFSDNSGYSVSMPDSNTVAIGARGNNGNGTNAGHVRVYSWNGNTWTQNGNDIDGESANDQSGWSVSMPDAKTVGIGACLNDGNGIDAGHVRIYSICATSNSINPTACSSYNSPSGNYTWTSSGTFMDTIPNFEGCDSVITVNLTIANNSSNINPTACSSYTSPSGNYTWTSSGTFMDTIPNTAGCDSVITVNLTIANNSSNINPTACFSYTSPSGNYTWTSSGIFMDTILNTAGCDSVITVNLTIYNVDVSIINSSPTLISNAIGDSYQWLDCNNAMAIINNEINQNFTATSNGIYAVQVTQNGCIDTSDCEVVNNVGIITLTDEYSIEVYPNPSKGSFTVFIKNVSEGSLEVFDLAGRLQQIHRLNNSETYPVDGLHAGVYLLVVVMNNGRKEVKRIEVI